MQDVRDDNNSDRKIKIKELIKLENKLNPNEFDEKQVLEKFSAFAKIIKGNINAFDKIKVTA